jgi:hypothetical protein
MKLLVLPLFILISLSVQANICDLNNSYSQRGWVLHDSSEFSEHLKRVQEVINEGLEDGLIEEDLNGVIATNRTIDGSRIYVKTISWDDLKTERDLMYGDMAIFRDHFNTANILEVRWFDGSKKHVVYNDEFLNCISIIPPYAENSIM